MIFDASRNPDIFISHSSVNRPYAGVIISGQVSGLKPGLHGFHVHMEGALGDQCKVGYISLGNQCKVGYISW